MESSLKNDLSVMLEAVLDTAVDGIITIDTEGIIVKINQAALNLFGYSKDEVENKSINILMGHHDATRHDMYIKRFIETKQAKIIGIGREVQGMKKDGSFFPFRLAVSEVILNDKILFTGIVHDMTDFNQVKEQLVLMNKDLDNKVIERTYEVEQVVNQLLSINKKLKDEINERKLVEEKLTENEKKLLESLEKEKELGELKSKFVSIASHEFRTPLATILSSASLISKYPLAEQQENRDRHIGKIKLAVNNLTGILNDFLSLSKLEEDAIKPVFEDTDLIPLLHSIAEELSLIKKDNQDIIIDSKSESVIIATDPKVFKNIMFNLLSNAIKYSSKDIKCFVNVTDVDVHVIVEDKGIGIPAEDQKHLFERFFRASNVSNIQGTGLGLNIVRKYAELLGGYISLESKENEGTRVTLGLKHH